MFTFWSEPSKQWKGEYLRYMHNIFYGQFTLESVLDQEKRDQFQVRMTVTSHKLTLNQSMVVTSIIPLMSVLFGLIAYA